jgi:hypothetical protein
MQTTKARREERTYMIVSDIGIVRRTGKNGSKSHDVGEFHWKNVGKFEKKSLENHSFLSEKRFGQSTLT